MSEFEHASTYLVTSPPPTSTHAFVVPAYGQSPYLEVCLRSLAEQSTQSNIIVSTSTPYPGLQQLASDYGAKYFEHAPNRGMAHDWNQGVGVAESQWVTIAHQDDIYLPGYTSEIMASILNVPDACLAFTNYAEILGDTVRRGTKLLKIKQALLHAGFLGRKSISDQFSKLNCLRFGCPIPCPSVCFRKDTHADFSSAYKVNMDWQAWLNKAKEPGAFVWVSKELMHHRIHERSETTEGIRQGYRADEDLALLRQVWPDAVARLISIPYRAAYASNQHN